jgi:hypothetical protein
MLSQAGPAVCYAIVRKLPLRPQVFKRRGPCTRRAYNKTITEERLNRVAAPAMADRRSHARRSMET